MSEQFDKLHERIAAEATGDFYCESEQVRSSLKCQKPCDSCWKKFAPVTQRATCSQNGHVWVGTGDERVVCDDCGIERKSILPPSSTVTAQKTDDEELANGVLKLTATVRYLVGIAERGEGRPMLDDETAEPFVLRYVQRLEQELHRARSATASASHVSVPCALAERLMSYARTYNLIDVAALKKLLEAAQFPESKVCPHAAPHVYCEVCPVSPCAIGLPDDGGGSGNRMHGSKGYGKP